MSYKDNFSEQAADYAQYRPTYPPELIEYISQPISHRQTAWDCATGNGQVARLLANHFEQIIATDASQAQIDQAPVSDKIIYRQAPAENSGLADQSIDLITVGQAIHWFDFDAFYQEVRRVAKPGAYIAIWGYSLPHISESINKVIRTFYEDILGDEYWDPERRHLDHQYQTIPFPFEILDSPKFYIKRAWSLNHFLGFLNSWSALRKYIRKNEQNPVELIQDSLNKAWGDTKQEHPIIWDIYLKVGKVFL